MNLQSRSHSAIDILLKYKCSWIFGMAKEYDGFQFKYYCTYCMGDKLTKINAHTRGGLGHHEPPEQL